jgi:spermidine/putrescine transport system ATP-binding protein
MAENAVQLRSVSKHFGSVKAVEDVSLTIHYGEFFSLLGPSGCGKTTTLRLIAGFELPDRGEVLIDGELQGETPPYRRPVNTVFQNYALFPHMRVGENVAFGLQMRKVPRDDIRRRVASALEMVQLPGMEGRKPEQLSGGQQQRVALARALVNEPKVLLLDEPLGALDLKLRKAMQLELKNLQERVGITFVYVTHDQEEALTMSDRIAVMEGGRVLQVDEPHRIYERPVNRFVADFIGDTNFLVGVVEAAGRGTATIAVDGELPMRIPVERLPLHEQQVTVAIRPEKISLHAQPPDDRAVPGTVEEVIYFGTNTCYLVRLTDRTTVTVRRQNEQVGQDLSVSEGEQVYLYWQPESARLLTE